MEQGLFKVLFKNRPTTNIRWLVFLCINFGKDDDSDKERIGSLQG